MFFVGHHNGKPKLKTNKGDRFKSYEKGLNSVLRLVLYKKEEEYMVIYFRINKQNEPYLTFHLPMTISIQKGIFEVTDPEHPKLIPIKKGRK